MGVRQQYEIAVSYCCRTDPTDNDYWVWIHGGAYKTGTGSNYPIEALAAGSNRSVAIVSVSYRLNVSELCLLRAY